MKAANLRDNCRLAFFMYLLKKYVYNYNIIGYNTQLSYCGLQLLDIRKTKDRVRW